MAKKEFDNNGRVSIWKAVSKGGKEYYNGTVTLDGTDYKIVLFDNETDGNDKRPIFTGTLEEKAF